MKFTFPLFAVYMRCPSGQAVSINRSGSGRPAGLSTLYCSIASRFRSNPSPGESGTWAMPPFTGIGRVVSGST